MAIERELLDLYRDPTLDRKPALLESRGGAFYSEAAAQLIASLHAGTGDVQVVDVRNAGALPDLPDDGGRRGPGPDRPRRRPSAAARAARTRAARPGPGGQGLRGAGDRGGRDRRPGGSPSWRSSPTRSCRTSRRPRACSTRSSRSTSGSCPSSPSRPDAASARDVQDPLDVEPLRDERLDQGDLLGVGRMRLDEQVVDLGGHLVGVLGDERREQVGPADLVDDGLARPIAAGQDEAEGAPRSRPSAPP